MPTKIARPDKDEYAPHFEIYISEVKNEDAIEALENGKVMFLDFLRALPVDRLDYRYKEGKWSTREVIIHMLDVERIFAYRALRFSRNDKTPVAGFDDDQYIAESNATDRTINSLIEEYAALRQSTIELFKNITPEMSRRTGIANGKEVSVRALGYIIPGHEIHHLSVIKERYM
jgi:uncharacterized damage-inducible protein DinB